MNPNKLLENICVQVTGRLDAKYKHPATDAMAYVLEFKSLEYLGSITAWNSGAVDWHIFHIKGLKENLIGHRQCENEAEMEELIINLLI